MHRNLMFDLHLAKKYDIFSVFTKCSHIKKYERKEREVSMKRTKIIAILLALILVFALAPSASALTPIFTGNLTDATYTVGEPATPLSVGLTIIGTTFQWQSWSYLLHIWLDITGETSGTYTPPTSAAGTRQYRCEKDSGGTVSVTSTVTITVLEKPALSLTPATQTITAGGQATFTVTAANTDGWDLTHSYWAWGPTNDPADIAGDFSSSGSIAVTTYTPTLNTAGSIFYFYVGEYTDQANGTKNITVFSNGAQAVVNAVVPFTNPFIDVHPTDWFYTNVMDAVQMGLVNGTTPTTYAPNGNLSIGSAIKLAACMHQYYHDGAVTLVNGTVIWYDTYVDYAIANGIISSSTYAGRYDNNATRAEYVKIFYYALPTSEYTQIQTVPPGAIPDVSITDSYGYEVYTFYRAGILQGNDALGTFAPNSNITRSGVAAIISRMMTSANRISTPYPWL